MERKRRKIVKGKVEIGNKMEGKEGKFQNEERTFFAFHFQND